MPWNGDERRRENRASIYEEVGALKVRVAHIETRLEKLDVIDSKLDALTTILSQGKGAARLLQIIFIALGPIVLAIYWIKDHVK